MKNLDHRNGVDKGRRIHPGANLKPECPVDKGAAPYSGRRPKGKNKGKKSY